MNIYLFLLKGIPKVENELADPRPRQGAWILGCVADTDLQCAKQRVIEQINLKKWVAGPLLDTLVLLEPEKQRPERLLLLERNSYNLVQTCLNSPDKGPALEFYSTLLEGFQPAERLDV